MITGARQLEEQRQKAEWQRSSMQTQAIMNGYIKKPQPLDYLYKKLFGDTHVKSNMTLEEYHKRMEEADRLIALRRKGNATDDN